MANQDPATPTLSRYPPSVAFIDNHLSKYHPVFATSSMQYDPMAQHYVPNTQVMVPGSSNGIVQSGASAADPSPRPLLTNVKIMEFWNDIFSAAMQRFLSTKASKDPSQAGYSIRDKSDWDSVYDTLTLARKKYEQDGGSVGQWLRKVRRKAADNIAPGAEAAKIGKKLAPNDPYATPVFGAIEVLCDAVKTAANVRHHVLDYFDNLVPIFSDVELFLGTFKKDENIRNASVDLTATTLEAIEQAIGFFVSNQFIRGAKAMGMGNDYQKKLLESLELIQKKSRDLMQEATKSHFFQANLYSQETRKMYEHMIAMQQQTNQMVGAGLNGFHKLLVEHEKLMNERRAAEERAIAAEKAAVYLLAQNEMLRAASPGPPLEQTQASPALEWHINQATLLQMLDPSEQHVADISFVTAKKEQLPASERALTERIISTELFRNWIVSPSSAKLLIHWDFRLPKTIAGVSPLSLFCADLVNGLRGKKRFLSALFFCGLHVDAAECDGLVGARAMLINLVGQLLRQYTFDTRLLHQVISLEGLQESNLDALTSLLIWLARQLPPTMTLLLFIDGAVLFERDEFEMEALSVFASLIQLVGDMSVVACVKLLFTSTPGTDVVRGAFEDEDLIVNVEGLPQLGWVPSEERLVRELDGEGGTE